MPTQPQDTPPTTPEERAALSDLTRTTMEVARDLRHAAARLDEAERRHHRARPAPAHRPAGHLSDQFEALRKTILDTLPASRTRSDALLCLAAAKDKAAHAAVFAATHDSYLQAVHHLPDTTGPEDAA
jgi:hypothetical protein